jgi:autotransporter-associated beta strand protein
MSRYIWTRELLRIATVVAFAGGANAAVFTWDNAVTAGIQDGAGTWDAATAKWTLDGGANNVVYGNSGTYGDSAIIGSGGAGGTITVSGGAFANTVTFGNTVTAGYTLSGGSIAIGGAGAAITSASTTNVTINSAVTLNADASASNATTAYGTMLRLNALALGTNRLTLTAGAVYVQFGRTSGNIDVNSGATLFSAEGTVISNTFGTITIKTGGRLDTRDFNNTGSPAAQAITLDGGYISNAGITGNNGGGAGLILKNNVAVTSNGGTLHSGNTGWGISVRLTGSLSGSGPLTVTGGNNNIGAEFQGDTSAYDGTLTGSSGTTYFNPSAGTQTFNGIIAGTRPVTKKGSGTTVLAATNTYTGATTVNAGWLNLSGSLKSAITVSSGAGLVGAGSTTGNITFNNGSYVQAQASGTSVQGANITANATTFILPVVNATGAVTGDVVRNTGNAPTVGSFSAAAFRSGSVANAAGLTTVSYTSEAKAWPNAAGTWDLAISTPWTGTLDQKFYWGDAVTFGAISANRVVILTNSLAPSSITVNNTANTYTFSSPGAIIGATALAKSGAGSLVMKGVTNAFTGGTTISGGVLCLGDGTANSLCVNSLGTGPVTVQAGGTLKFQNAAGTAAFYLPNPVTLDGGTVYTVDNYLHLAAPVSVTANGGTLDHHWDSKALWLDGVLSGSGALTVKTSNTGSDGVHFVNGANSYSGTVTVNSACAKLDSDTALQYATVNLAVADGLKFASGVLSPVIAGLSGSANENIAGVTLSVGNSSGSDTTYSGVLSGAAGSLTKIGANTLTLSGVNAYGGTTKVSAGTLALGASGALTNTAAIALAAGATFDVSAKTADFTVSGSGPQQTLACVSTSGTASINATGRTVTLASGAPLSFRADGAAGTVGKISVTGSLTLNANAVTVSVAGAPLGIGTNTLMDCTDTLTLGGVFPPPVITGSGIADGAIASVLASGNSLILTVTLPTATITAPANFPDAISTTYGTASAATSVAVSGSSLTADILATAPAGLEISSDGVTYGATATFAQSGGVASGTLYVRCKNNAPAGIYDSQNVVLTSAGAPPVNVATAASGNTVGQKALTVAGVTAQNKAFDGTVAATLVESLLSAEAFGSGDSGDGKPYDGDALTLTCTGSTFANAGPGADISVTAGTFVLGGAAAGNYTVSQPTGLSLSATIVTRPTWTSAASGSWPVTNNWLAGVIGSGTNSTADFTTLAMETNVSVTLDGARTIGNLWFDDQASTKHAWTLSAGTGDPLTLAVTSGMPVISNSVAATISTAIAGSQGLAKSGAGTLTLSAQSTYGGGTVVNGGTLVGNAGGWYANRAIGSGSLTVNSGATAIFTGSHYFGVGPGGQSAIINGGTIQFDSANYVSGLTFTNGGALTGAGELRVPSTALAVTVQPSSDTAVMANGQSLVYNNMTFNVADGGAPVDLLVSGPIYNSYGIIKAGDGTMMLTGSGTYAGATTVTGGTLVVNGSLGAAANAVTVAAGAVLAGTGSVSRAVSVASGGAVAPGSAVDAVGVLSVASNVTLQAGSHLAVRLAGRTDSDRLACASAVAVGGATLEVSFLDSSLSRGLYTVLSAPAISGTFSNMPDGSTFVLGTEKFLVTYPGATNVVLQALPKGTLMSLQ